jgi:hypothetical protein
MSNPWTPSGEDREWHAAATDDNCLGMETLFRGQGLDVNLVATEATGNSILPRACIFDGPDSDPEVNRWNSQGQDDDD